MQVVSSVNPECVGLVVDNDPVRSNIILRVLASAGLTAMAVNGGREALKECRSRQRQVSFLVVAAAIPDIAALQLANLMNRVAPGAPVLFITNGEQLPIPEHHQQLWMCASGIPEQIAAEAAMLLRSRSDAAAIAASRGGSLGAGFVQ